MSFPYSTELTVSNQLARIDLFNPALWPVVAMLRKNQMTATRDFVPPSGIALHTECCLSRDGVQVECFVLEPMVSGDYPTMVYCHGGAFLLPVQTACLRLAVHYVGKLGLRVVIPEYRLLPRHPAPAALDDILGVCDTLSPTLLYGESAGGALAVGAALEAAALRGLMLIYPALDDGEVPNSSKTLYPQAPWSLRTNQAMWRAYLEGVSAEQRSHLVPEAIANLSCFPETYIEAEEIDILRDEALRFAERLRSHGIQVETIVNQGAYHGFDSQLDSPYVQRVLSERVKAIRRLGGMRT